MSAWSLLRAEVLAKVVEVGTFEDDASPMAVVEFGEGKTVRFPVTTGEARALGSMLGQHVPFRLAMAPVTP
jgi:hypothetical protein